jgi:hypothetical protein
VENIVDNYYDQAVGKLQAESMMSTAASLFYLSKKPRFNHSGKEKANDD